MQKKKKKTFTKYLMEHDLYLNDFCHKRKTCNFDPYNIFFAIPTNIPVRCETKLVLWSRVTNMCECLLYIV